MRKKFFRVGEKVFTLNICGNDINRFSIVVHSSLIPSAQPMMPAYVLKSAEIMQEYLYKLTDSYIPIYHDNYPATTLKQIAIGGTSCAFDDSHNIVFSDDEYYIKTVDGNLIVNGGKRGVLYGVYEFLENYCGLRFFTKDCERIIALSEIININDICDRYNPQFEYRDLCDWTAWNPDFSVKMHLNGNFVRNLREEDGFSRGLSGGADGLVHTFEKLLPSQKYYETHPEWFALTEQGERDPSGICYSNEDALNELVKNALSWLDNEKDPTIVSLTINDGNPSFCHCKKCEKIYKKGGNETDATLDFLNRATKLIKEKYPNVDVDTIAYGKISAPPKFVKPSKGIIIRSCAFRGAMGLSIDKAAKVNENTSQYVKSLNNALSLYEKVYLWDYPYVYSSITTIYPVIHTLLDNYNFYAKKGIKGVYVNGNTNVGEFTELKVYLISKLLYRPSMRRSEFDRHIREFLQGYYGKGWRYINQFILLSEEYSSKNFGCGSLPDEIIPVRKREDGSVDRSFIEKSYELFNNAYNMASTIGEKKRVKKSSLQVDYYDLYVNMDNIMLYGTEEQKQAVEQKNKRFYDDLVHLGVPRIGERFLLPIVKNFKQSPLEWSYMNGECGWACDRNRSTYERIMYIMLVSDLPLGTKVDVEFTLRTNNENPKGFLGAFDGNSVVFTKTNPKWSQSGEYKKYTLKNVEISMTKQLCKAVGKDFSDEAIRILPVHLKGVILSVEQLDSGAYVFVKDVKFTVLK